VWAHSVFLKWYTLTRSHIVCFAQSLPQFCFSQLLCAHSIITCVRIQQRRVNTLYDNRLLRAHYYVCVYIYISYMHSCTEHTFKSQAYISLYTHLVNAPPPEEVIGSSESGCVCVCMRVSVCLCLCVYVCMYTCLVIVHTACKIHVWKFTCMYRCVYNNWCACTDVYVCVRDLVVVHTACKIHVWKFTCMYRCVYDNWCACTDVYVCVRDLVVVHTACKIHARIFIMYV